MKKIPVYQNIKNIILEHIHQGIWRVGQAIPTELALTEQFQVSRMTVNRALKELTEEGILERRQGSGTFVAQKKFNHTFIEIRNIASDIHQAQQSYHTIVLQNKILKHSQLPLEIQSAFNTPDAQICLVNIVHFADNIPIQCEERWVDLHLIPSFAEQDFTLVNTSEFLINNVPLERGIYTISAQYAPKWVAEALQMESKQPSLLLSRQTWSQGRVVTKVNMWHCGERYQFTGYL
ncbi:MAG: GntR family transcriptional regulator [Cardiobacteriaceae bacterium]|nr:GntR family transcriptional regulator [Cardiobacteriaceae bacterium]